MDLIIKISGVNSKSLKKSITEPAIINAAATNLVLLTTIIQIYYRFLQKKGVNNIRTVNNSNRPISIKNEAHHFPKAGKAE